MKVIDEQKTVYQELPFCREIGLIDQVVVKLSELTDYSVEYYRSLPGRPIRFSIIPAIKHVQEVTGWGLAESKEYVEKIYVKHVDKVEAARVEYIKGWKQHGTDKTTVENAGDSRPQEK